MVKSLGDKRDKELKIQGVTETWHNENRSSRS